MPARAIVIRSSARGELRGTTLMRSILSGRVGRASGDYRDRAGWGQAPQRNRDRVDRTADLFAGGTDRRGAGTDRRGAGAGRERNRSTRRPRSVAEDAEAPAARGGVDV